MGAVSNDEKKYHTASCNSLYDNVTCMTLIYFNMSVLS